MEHKTTIEDVVNRELSEVTIAVELSAETGIEPTDYKALHQAKLAVLKKEVEALPAITDKKTYEANLTYKNRLVKHRTSIDKARKAILEPAKTQIELVNTYLGTNADSGLQASVKAYEDEVNEKLRAYDEEQARIEAEARRVIQARYEGRAARLQALGCGYNGSGFFIEGLVIFDTDVRNQSDEMFDLMVKDSIEPVAKRLVEEAEEEARQAQAAHEAEQRRLEAEAEARKKEAERQAAEAKRLEDERAELEKQRAELRKGKNDLRRNELIALGAVASHEAWVLFAPGLKTPIDCEDLHSLSDEDWTETKDLVRRAKIAEIELRKEQHRQDALQDARWAELKDLGASRDEEGVWTYASATVTDHQLRTMTEEQWAPVLAKFAEEVETLTDEDGIALSNLAAGVITSDDEAADRALSNSSGIYESTGETLVRETEEVLEVIATNRQMMQSMATRLEAERQCANRMGGDATTLAAEATWSYVQNRLQDCVMQLREAAKKD
jgi:hypothetical protein